MYNYGFNFAVSKSQKPLTLEYEVWKMQTIGKGGPFHTRLMKENIKTVRDFLTQYFLSHEKLLSVRIYSLAITSTTKLNYSFHKYNFTAYYRLKFDMINLPLSIYLFLMKVHQKKNFLIVPLPILSITNVDVKIK